MKGFLRRILGISGWAMIACGVFFCLAGIGGLFLLSAVILEEFTNGVRIINDWAPDRRGFIGFFATLPSNLVLLIGYYPFAAFATLIFFPLVAVLMPVYAGFFLDDWTPAAFGWLPFVSGLVIVVCGLLVREIMPAAGASGMGSKKRKNPSAHDRG